MKNMFVALGFLVTSGAVTAGVSKEPNCGSGYWCPLGCCLEQGDPCKDNSCQTTHISAQSGIRYSLSQGAVFTCEGKATPEKITLPTPAAGIPSEVWKCPAAPKP